MARGKQDVFGSYNDMGRNRDTRQQIDRVMCQQRVALAMESFERLRTGIAEHALPVRVHDFRLVVETIREKPRHPRLQKLFTAEVRGGGLPGFDHIGDVRVRSGTGADESETAHTIRMIQRQMLRDHAAHRDPDNVGRTEVQFSNELSRVIGELTGSVSGDGTLTGLPDVAIVKKKASETCRYEVRKLGRFPAGMVRADTRDEHDWRAGPDHVVKDPDSVCFGKHRVNLMDKRCTMQPLIQENHHGARRQNDFREW